MIAQHHLSERRACRLVGLSRDSYRNPPVVDEATQQLSAKIVEVNGRLVTFEVEGRDSVEPICRARHTRFVVDVTKTAQRLAAKAQKAGLA